MHHIDIAGRDSRFDAQAAIRRHDIHQGLARPQHTADRIHLHVDDHSVDRGHHFSTADNVVGSGHAVTQIGVFGLHFLQLANNLVQKTCAGVQNGQLSLTDLLPGTRNGRVRAC